MRIIITVNFIAHFVPKGFSIWRWRLNALEMYFTLRYVLVKFNGFSSIFYAVICLLFRGIFIDLISFSVYAAICVYKTQVQRIDIFD